MMRFNAKELVEALTIMSKMDKGVYYRSNLVFLRTQDGITELLGTNGLVEVITEFHTDGDDDRIAVNKRSLLNAVKQVGKGSEVVTIFGGYDNIRVGGLKLKTELVDVDRLTSKNISTLKFSVKEFATALAHVVYAAKESHSSRDVIHIVGGRTFYACDSCRLAKYEAMTTYDLPEEVCLSGSAARLLIEAVRILKGTAGEIGITDEMIVVRLGRYTIGMKKEQCALPAYESVLAQEHRTIVYVKAKEMINALEQIKKIDKMRFIHIEIDPDNTETIRLFSRDIDGSIGLLIDVPAVFDNKENEKVSKSFNIQYLLDALKPVGKELITLCDPGEDKGWIDIVWNGYRAMIMGAVLT